MIVWLDDARPLPAGYCKWVKTFEEAVEVLSSGDVTCISLDHDLGTEKTGYDVAKWIEKNARIGSLAKLEWRIHTANQVGGDNIERALKSADSYWKLWERGGPKL